MHFIIETETQLSNLLPTEECFVHVITSNHAYHPKLSRVSLVYYNNGDKGYIISISHSEAFSISFQRVLEFVSSHKVVWVYDKKYHSYFLPEKILNDIHITQLATDGQITRPQSETSAHRCLGSTYRELEYLNEIIPISKHYEKWENVYKNSIRWMKCVDTVDLSIPYKMVEENGIKVNTEELVSIYGLEAQQFSIRDGVVYTSYNLYNPTGRPTNSFNYINFLAIPKDEKIRKCFTPKLDYFVEFDFDAYHPRIIAQELGVDLPSTSLHEYFGKLYYKKEILSPEEYQKSKEYTFRQLYGGPMDEYMDIEFFRKIKKQSDSLWDWYQCDGHLKLPTGNVINDRDISQWKLFNYWVQNLETYKNSFKISKICNILHSYRTKLVLITYDSFLFDYSVEDGKELLVTIKDILSEGGYPVKHKWGTDYNL